MAMEELKKLQHENNLLLEEIQVLETEMQGAVSVTNVFRIRIYMDDNVKFHLQQSYADCWNDCFTFHFSFLILTIEVNCTHQILEMLSYTFHYT